MGLPIEPPLCSDRCYDEYFKNKKNPPQPPNRKQMKTTSEEIAQWVIDNRYSKGEYQTMPDHELYHTLVDKINATQRTAEVGDGWISVEKEPKEAGEYLCYNIENGVMAVQYYDLREWGYLASIKTVVTHWQPLPEPPKNSEEKGGES